MTLVILCAVATFVFLMIALAVWLRVTRRAPAADYFSEIQADPDRHRGSELPSLGSGWPEEL